jgi:hypothetical protein
LEAVSAKYQGMVDQFTNNSEAELIAISIRPVVSTEASQSSLTNLITRFQDLEDHFSKQSDGLGDGPLAISIRY